MSKLTTHFVHRALASESIWDLGNAVLYKLCSDHPTHSADNAIIAKIWLIGRSYAAAIERRREKGEYAGDAFYVRYVAPRIRSSNIDVWLQELRQDKEGNPAITVAVHKRLTELLSALTGLDKRSFASKYLHFHFPDRFFIYDSRAEKSISQLLKGDGQNRRPSFREADRDYARFFRRCEHLSRRIQALLKREVSPREVDKVPLAWANRSAQGLDSPPPLL